MNDNILRKMGRVEKYLSLVEKLKPECDEKILSDEIYRSALLYNLYLMADSCIALAELVLKEKRLPSAQSYHDAIDALGEQGLLPREFAYDFAKIAGFRNFLAHDYEKIDEKKICREMLEKTGEVREYLSLLGAALP